VFPSGWRIREGAIEAIKGNKVFEKVKLEVLSQVQYEKNENLLITAMAHLNKEIMESIQEWNNSKMKSFVSS